MHGKSINLFLMDGTPDGRIKCSIPNWTGVAYKVSRTALELCKSRDDFKHSGIYFLFGRSEIEDRQVAYIGQADVRKNGGGILQRLLEHERNPDKDYWTEAIVFTTTTNTFGPTEISYLEHRFYSIAREAHRYDVQNDNTPSVGNVTEEKESELEEYIDYARMILGALGHKVLEPVVVKNDPGTGIVDIEPLLHFRHKKIKACGKRSADGFVVLKGSRISEIVHKSAPRGVGKNREKYRESIQDWTLTDDLLFTSPSSAAAFVGGASLSGNETWVDEAGRTLKDLIEGADEMV